MKTTLKDIREYARMASVKDVTNYSGDLYEIARRATETVVYSAGMYGINGVVKRDPQTGEMFAVTTRNSNLFIMI